MQLILHCRERERERESDYEGQRDGKSSIQKNSNDNNTCLGMLLQNAFLGCVSQISNIELDELL